MLTGLTNQATPYERLADLGLQLPPPPPPIARFHTAVVDGGLMLLSGQGPSRPDGTVMTGKVGGEITRAAAYEHARLTGLNLLAVMHDTLGDLGRVRRILKVFGMVNATPDFGEHSAVIDGCSDLFCDVFGEIGEHARTAIGVGSLPRGITVEIEAMVAVR